MCDFYATAHGRESEDNTATCCQQGDEGDASNDDGTSVTMCDFYATAHGRESDEADASSYTQCEDSTTVPMCNICTQARERATGFHRIAREGSAIQSMCNNDAASAIQSMCDNDAASTGFNTQGKGRCSWHGTAAEGLGRYPAPESNGARCLPEGVLSDP